MASSSTDATESLAQELAAVRQELALAKERADAQEKEVEAAKAQAAQAAAQAAARQETGIMYVRAQQLMRHHYKR